MWQNVKIPFFLCLSLLLLNGCFALTPHSLNKISAGMSKEETVGIMGKPYSTKYMKGEEYSVYYLHEDVIDLFFRQNKFPFIGIYPILRTGQEYYIVYKDDVVVAYGDRPFYKGSLNDKY